MPGRGVCHQRSGVCHQGSCAWHHLCPCTAPGFWQAAGSACRAVRHMAAHFQLMFTVKGRAKCFALRADHEPGWFLMLQP